MQIRQATQDDWPGIWPFFDEIVRAGETYAYPLDLTSDTARELWMVPSPGRTVVAITNGQIVGSAHLEANRPGRGSHVSTASFMVAATGRSQGVGRGLGEYAISWARDAGYQAMQFNAVVESNTAAVRLWQSLGFSIIGTVPAAFDHPRHGLVGLHVMHQFL